MTRDEIRELANLAHAAAAEEATHEGLTDGVREAIAALDFYILSCPQSVRCDGCGHMSADVGRFLLAGLPRRRTGYQDSADESLFFCPGCWTQCHVCSTPVTRSGWVSLRHGARVCESCAEHFTFCGNCGDECGEVDDENMGPCCATRYGSDESTDAIRDYHSSSFRPVPGKWMHAHQRRCFGVELEVEMTAASACTRGACAERILAAHRDIVIEEDGSLFSGFEIITQPCGMDRQRDIWKSILRATPSLVSGVRSHQTTTCGLHVHVSRQGVSSFTLAKAVVFVNDPENEALIRAVARRYGSTHYAQFKAKKLATAYLDDRDRYQSVNLCNGHTIEFRIFKGSLNYHAVLAAIQFSHAVLSFAAETAANGLTTAAFLAYIQSPGMREDTDELRLYLAARAPTLMPTPVAAADRGRKKYHASCHTGRYADCPHCAKDRSAHDARGDFLHLNESELD